MDSEIVMTERAKASRRRRPSRLLHLPEEVVVRLEWRHRSNKGQPTMAKLGISDNTWRKIRAGMPIRASVVERLCTRLSDDAEG